MISWPSLPVVAARVAVGALVAAAGLAADQALAEVLPPAAFLDARRTDVHRRVDVDHPDRVVARRDHRAHRTITRRGTSNENRATQPSTPDDDRCHDRPGRRRRRHPRLAGSPAGRRPREPPLARAPRRGRPDPRRRRDGHDAVRGRPPVRRPARDVERRPPRGRPADPPRLPRRRVADRDDEHVRRQPAPAAVARAGRARVGAEPDGGDPAPSGGGRRGRPGARRRRHRPDRRDHGAARDARRGRGRGRLRRAGRGADRRRRRPDLDRDDVASLGDRGGDQRRPAGLARDPDRGDDDVRHARLHDDGRVARGRR